MKTSFSIFLFGFVTALQLLAGPTPGTVFWTFDAGKPITSTPALAPDGTVYLGTEALLFVAVTNTGSIASNKWSIAAATGSAAIGVDGTIYLGSGCAINPDGSQKWAYPFQASRSSSPAIGSDGTVYLEAEGQLYALTPSGAKRWAYNVYGSDNVSPVIGPDGTIYISSDNLYAVNPDGTLKWKSGSAIAGDSAAIGADGSIYVTGVPLYAFSGGGIVLWTTGTNAFNGASPSIGTDGTIYVSSFLDRHLTAVTSSGDIKWQALSGVTVFHGVQPATVPAIDSNGMLYFCVSNSIVALTSDGKVKWSIFAGVTAPGFYLANTSPIIGPDGTLYAALGSTLYAIATGTNGPANSPWPMYRQNARHTGKVERPALKQPQKRSDANFQFQLYGDIGQTYTVESSTNLSLWTSLTSFVATTLPMDVVELSATNFPARFYRASSPP